MLSAQTSSAPSIPERATHSAVQFLPLAGLSDLALITLDNGEPPNRPNSFGLQGFAELEETVEGLRSRVTAGQISAVALTGKAGSFGAGADLNTFAAISEPATARLFLARGKEVLGMLRALGLPTFAFVNGLALGGGLEAALFCDYRTVAAGVRALGQPETHLGLVPGWGGTYHLPRLVGAENALRVIIDNPQSGNRMTTAQQALELGIVDEVIDAEDGDFVQRSAAWAGSVLRGEHVPARPDVLTDAQAWTEAVERRRPLAERLDRAGAPAVAAALTLVTNARSAAPVAGLALEEDLCADLIMSDTLRASLYAFDLLSHRARRPVGVPKGAAPLEVRAIAVVGGAEALESAVGHAVSSGVPVTLVVPDESAAEQAREVVQARCATLAARAGRGPAEAERLRTGLSVTTAPDAVGTADVVLVVPAPDVTEAPVGVPAFVWDLCADSSVVVIVSNSSDVIGAAFEQARGPERVVGWCEAAPSAPLVEVVRTPATAATTLATTVDLVSCQRHTAVVVGNQPGFVLDRVMMPLRQWVETKAEGGMAAPVLDDVLVRLGLPRGLAAIGLEGLARDAGSSPAADARADVDPLVVELQDLVARAVADLLASGVVDDVRDVDVVMLAGAGFPLHLGGLAPALDRSGAAERATGQSFLDRGVASVPAPGTGY